VSADNEMTLASYLAPVWPTLNMVGC